MSQPALNNLKIQVLLAEYAALRAEILSRSAAKFQISTVAGTATVAIIAFSVANELIGVGVLLILTTAALVLFGLKMLDLITRRVAAQLRRIETQVNELAGERLLRWENESGVGPLPYRRRLKDIFSLRLNQEF